MLDFTKSMLISTQVKVVFEVGVELGNIRMNCYSEWVKTFSIEIEEAAG